MRYTKRKCVWLLTLLLVGAYVYSDARPSFALNRPTSPGIGYYIQSWWANPFRWGDGRMVTLSFRKGYWAGAGSPYPTIFLHFGRQALSNNQWSIQTVEPENAIHNDTWVQYVAQQFIDGYNDNPAHANAVANIAIGTSNSDYSWYCHNNDPNNLSPLWYTSGNVWGNLLYLLTAGPRVVIQSGNDIESWIGQFADWKSCGIGALSWYDGFEGTGYRFNYDFGNNTHGEDTVYPVEWTQDQTYQTAWGRHSAHPYPQIYNTGSGWSAAWVLTRQYGYMFFSGVLSDDPQGPQLNGTYPDPGPTSLSWSASWDNLNNALVQAGYPDDLQSVVVNMSRRKSPR